MGMRGDTCVFFQVNPRQSVVVGPSLGQLVGKGDISKSPTAALLRYCDSAASVQDGAGRASEAVTKAKEEAAAVEAIWAS